MNFIRTGPARILGTFVTVSFLLSVLAIFAQTSQSAHGLTGKELSTVQGEVGIAVEDTARKKHYEINGNKLFPMHSVCKVPVSVAILRLADEGKLSLQEKMIIRRADLVQSYSPLKDVIKGKQAEFTVRELLTWAISDSDSTACDVLIGRAGGVKEVNRILAESGINGIRIDRTLRLSQPDSLQIGTFLDDPRDTAEPRAMVDMLQKLYNGSLLSKASTAMILEDLFNCKTGTNRLTAGLPVGWRLAHKTGTGREVAGQSAGTNDVGVMVGPQGQTIYIAVFTKGSRAKLEAREALMAKVAAKAAAGEL